VPNEIYNDRCKYNIVRSRSLMPVIRLTVGACAICLSVCPITSWSHWLPISVVCLSLLLFYWYNFVWRISTLSPTTTQRLGFRNANNLEVVAVARHCLYTSNSCRRSYFDLLTAACSAVNKLSWQLKDLAMAVARKLIFFGRGVS